MFGAVVMLMVLLSATLTGADPTDDLNAAAAAACAGTHRIIHYPAGEVRFPRPVDPFPCAILIEGEGRGATRLVRDFQGEVLFTWIGGQDEGGGGLRDLMVVAGAGTYYGAAVWVLAHPETDGVHNTKNPHRTLLDNVTIGRELENASWWVGVYLDGSQNPDGVPGVPPGIRDAVFRNISVSGAHQAFYLNHARGINMTPVDCYIPMGPNGIDIIIDNYTQGVLVQSRTCNLYIINGSQISSMGR